MGISPARTAAYDLYFGGRAGANEGIPWSDIVGRDWLMENNIGIAYGAMIENAIGGHGNDRINGNQATNQFDWQRRRGHVHHRRLQRHDIGRESDQSTRRSTRSWTLIVPKATRSTCANSA